MKISGNDIRVGNILNYQNTLWTVHKIQHVQPGKGGAYVQTEMKNLLDSRKLHERFRSSETVERVHLEEVPFQFLYAEDGGETLVLMNQETFDQMTIKKDAVGPQAVFLQDGMIVKGSMYEGNPISIRLPDTIVMEITDTEPVIKGQTASSSFKPATLENGERVMVPPHISTGMRVVINVEDGSYIERSKD